MAFKKYFLKLMAKIGFVPKDAVKSAVDAANDLARNTFFDIGGQKLIDQAQKTYGANVEKIEYLENEIRHLSVKLNVARSENGAIAKALKLFN